MLGAIKRMASASFGSSLHAHIVAAIRDGLAHLDVRARDAKAMLAAPISSLFAAAKSPDANLDKDESVWVYFAGQAKDLMAVDGVFGQTLFADSSRLALHEDQRLCRYWCFSLCLSLSRHLFSLSIYLSIYLSVSIYLSISLSLYLSISISLSLSLYISITIYLSNLKGITIIQYYKKN